MKILKFLICWTILVSELVAASRASFRNENDIVNRGGVRLTSPEMFEYFNELEEVRDDGEQDDRKTAQNYHEVGNYDLPSTESGPLIQLPTVLKALRKLLTFLLQEFQHLNLDGIVGTRIAEGQLKVLWRRLATETSDVILPASELKEIYQLMMLSIRISELAIPNLIVTSREYYSIAGRLTDEGFWELNYPTRRTDQRLIYPVVLAEEAFNESMSDNCLSELLGTGKHQGHPCSPSDECWDIMTTSERSRYSLTHQILYLQVGEVMKCKKEMKAHIEKRNQVSMWHMGEIYCANVLREMQGNYAQGLTEHQQDLFMEQAAICGMYGFHDFFSMKWLRDILSWQKPEGCYGNSAKSTEYYDHTKLRVKREEKKLRDGCLSHKCAVAGAALALYVRYIVEDPTLSGNTRLHFILKN